MGQVAGVSCLEELDKFWLLGSISCTSLQAEEPSGVTSGPLTVMVDAGIAMST